MAAMIIMSACSAGSNNWPQFRGPDANMIVAGAYLPTKWSEELNVTWTFYVEGDSWTSP